ncbi:MAG: hypothetical protein ACR2N7_04075, partial [Acidimicrobiia bacterium]
MTPGRWLGIAAGTLVWAIALWFGFLAMSTSSVIGLAIIGTGLAFSMYTVAGFSGAADIGTTGFRASLIALGVALVVFTLAEVSDQDVLAFAAPVLAAGVGGTFALSPNDDPIRLAVRIGFVAVATILVAVVYTVDRTLYGLLAPLVS